MAMKPISKKSTTTICYDSTLVVVGLLGVAGMQAARVAKIRLISGGHSIKGCIAAKE